MTGAGPLGRNLVIGLIWAGMVTAPGAYTQPVNPEDEAAWSARGAEITRPFKKELKAALMSAMADGPAMAMEVCRQQAPAIARRLSAAGIEMGRSSHRLRNPENAPRDWVRPLLAEYVADPARRAPRVVRLAANRIGYVEPITIKPPCLTCHGTSVVPTVAAKIHLLYPQDQAMDFSPDEFRGLFWAEFPLEVHP